MAQSIGILKIWWRGKCYECVAGSSIKLPGMSNKTQVTGTSVQRYQTFSAGEVKATVILNEGMSLDAFDTDSVGELQVQTLTGQAWVMPDAFILDKPTSTDEGGKCPVTWNAGTYQEILK